MYLGLAVLVLLITSFGWLFLEYKKRWQRQRRLPPGPWRLPIVGYLPWIDNKVPHESLTHLSRSYGPICGLWMGSLYTVLLSDPQLVREALANYTFAGRAPLYLTHGIMKGNGLICAEGKLWKEQRSFVASCLRNFGMTKSAGPRRDQMEKRITDAVKECVMKLKARSQRGPLDPLETLHHCIGNLINRIVFGKSYEENDPVWKWLRHLQEEGVKEIGVAGPLNFMPFLRFLPGFERTIRSLSDGMSKTHEIYRTLLAEHRARKDESVDGTQCFLAAFDERARGMADEKSNNFTQVQMCHLLGDLFGAGTDTTLTTLRWFLLFMAAYPEEQTKIQKEIDRLTLEPDLGTDKEFGLEERKLLPRLEAAIAEVQRLRSVTPLGIPHGTMEDARLGDYDIPKGTMIVPLQWAIHTDPNYWPEPFEFRPDRFLDETGCFQAKFDAFIPFQTGRRICVGEELAKMILYIFAGNILKFFTLSIPPNTEIDLDGVCGITLLPKPHSLIFKERLQPEV